MGEFNRYVRVVQEAFSLRYELAYRIAWIWWTMFSEGNVPPNVTSAYRSPERQRALQNRWDAGDRTGLVARPATRSWHMQGLAIDVSTRSASFQRFRELAEFTGLRWGGTFQRRDPVHFDFPVGNPLSIDQLLAT